MDGTNPQKKVVIEETTEADHNDIERQNDRTVEEKATEAGSSSSFVTSESTTSSNEEESDVTIEMPDFCESEFKAGVNIDTDESFEPTTLLNVTISSLFFKEKAEEIVKEETIQITPEKPLGEPSVIEEKNENVEKEGATSVVLDPNHKGSLPPISHQLTQNTEPSPRGKIYFGKRYKKQGSIGEVNKQPAYKALNLTDFESSESMIEKAEHKKLDKQSNTFLVHNRKSDVTESKNSDTVIDIPDYEEGIKENWNQNHKKEEVVSKRSGLVPLLGMLGVGSLFYLIVSNQTT